MTREELSEVKDACYDATIFCTKEVLTADEVVRYLGISKSYLYKLTMYRQIPHYKPLGKMVYFDRKEIENWIRMFPIATDEALTSKALAYCATHPIEKKSGKQLTHK